MPRVLVAKAGQAKRKKNYLCLTNINFRKMQFNFQILYTHTHTLTHKQILTILIHLLRLSHRQSLENRFLVFSFAFNKIKIARKRNKKST